jgi:hypothetical protein
MIGPSNILSACKIDWLQHSPALGDMDWEGCVVGAHHKPADTPANLLDLHCASGTRRQPADLAAATA